jgi:hypothetical protein
MTKMQTKRRSAVKGPPVREDGVMMVLEQKPADLKSLRLLADTQIAIVSPNATALQRVRARNKQLAGQTFRFVSDAVRKTPAVISEAFAPDARALAILEGVRIAQEDLRKSGGAYDLDQVRTLLRGISRQAIDKRVQGGEPPRSSGP